MGIEIDLLKHYPKAKRDVNQRGKEKTEEDRAIARRFGKEFFDGERKHGYGGFSYAERFWKPVIPSFKEFYNLSSNSTILDIGCAKGFMLYDLITAIPGISVKGIDISEYAIENCKESVKEFVSVGDARSLPFEDNSFDLVISINTIHNLDVDELKLSLKEISRVSRKHSFITVDAYRNQVEKEAMFAWNLTAKTILSVEDWLTLFKEAEYEGDYFWFIP